MQDEAIGGFGSIISGIIFAASVNDDVRAVAFIFVGLLAFGCTLWTQRTGGKKAFSTTRFMMQLFR